MDQRSIRLIILFCALCLLAAGGAQLASAVAANPPAALVSLEGQWAVVWGDSAPPMGTAIERFTLTEESGRVIEVYLEDTLTNRVGELLAFDRQPVRMTGQWQATANGPQAAFLAQSIQPDGPAAPKDVTGPNPWVSILCKFNDIIDESKNLAFFQGMFASTYPGLDHYWRELSYDLVNLEGSAASGWYTLPRRYREYVHDGGLDWGLAATDCTGVADPFVDFSGFKGINLMFNYELDGYAWGGSWYLCLDGVCQSWSMTWEPPWGYSNIGVIAHENGHGFGLPHSSGMYGQTYDNAWDVMSDVWSNCDWGAVDPIYGCLAQQTIAYHKSLLGWIAPKLQFVAELGTRRTLTLERLALPQTSHYLVAQIPINGAPDYFYTVEARRKVGYDGYLPGDAIIIHEVNVYRERPAQVLDIDWNGYTDDEGAMWRVGESFVDATNGITVTVVMSTTTGFVVTIENQPQPPDQVTISGPQRGDPQTSYTFTADVLPAQTTRPITYTWQASSQSPITHTGSLSDTVTFSWPIFGSYAITVTASNAYGSATDSHTLLLVSPIESVLITGPDELPVQTSAAFTATIAPITATQPITYLWQASGQLPVTHIGGLSDMLFLTWTIPGPQAITVTAVNAGGAVSETHLLDVLAPPTSLVLSGPLTATVGEYSVFTATVTPTLTSLPLTYTWQFDVQSPLTHTAGLSDTLLLYWSEPGTYTLTVMAANHAGMVVTTWQVTITVAEMPKIYLPLIFRQP